jgi:hypothetical protein
MISLIPTMKAISDGTRFTGRSASVTPMAKSAQGAAALAR